uniref:Ig-like domain-containing protein n=1 Tax=Sparus aurata TaxID=8175 RepID=A0A671TMV9_SPAAU
MEVASLCLIISANLSIHPDRSQFFRYERISLSCTSQPCKGGFGDPRDSVCTIRNADPSDTGVYWCESEQGECSKPINITVAEDDVILESPSHPVTEGDTVTLRCSYKKRTQYNPTSDFSATFSKNGEFFGTEPAGKMILSSLSVTGKLIFHQPWNVSSPTPTLHPPLMSLPNLVCTILLFILYTVIFILSIYTYRRWARGKNNACIHLSLTKIGPDRISHS